MKQKKRQRMVLVTVGTTRFDRLIEGLDHLDVPSILMEKGFDKLVIQLGASEYFPHNLCPSSAPVDCERRNQIVHDDGFIVEWFQYVPSLKDLIEQSDLVISHAGSGSIFESLEAGASVITVPNDALMDNHQTELASELERRGHLQVATPSSLVEVLRQYDHTAQRTPYDPQDGTEIARFIDSMFD